MKTKKESKPVKATLTLSKKTTTGLRESLFETLDELKAGMIPASSANAIAKISGQILSTAKLELEYQKLNSKYTNNKKQAKVISFIQ